MNQLGFYFGVYRSGATIPATLNTDRQIVAYSRDWTLALFPTHDDKLKNKVLLLVGFPSKPTLDKAVVDDFMRRQAEALELQVTLSMDSVIRTGRVINGHYAINIPILRTLGVFYVNTPQILPFVGIVKGVSGSIAFGIIDLQTEFDYVLNKLCLASDADTSIARGAFNRADELKFTLTSEQIKGGLNGTDARLPFELVDGSILNNKMVEFNSVHGRPPVGGSSDTIVFGNLWLPNDNFTFGELWLEMSRSVVLDEARLGNVLRAYYTPVYQLFTEKERNAQHWYNLCHYYRATTINPLTVEEAIKIQNDVAGRDGYFPLMRTDRKGDSLVHVRLEIEAGNGETVVFYDVYTGVVTLSNVKVLDLPTIVTIVNATKTLTLRMLKDYMYRKCRLVLISH